MTVVVVLISRLKSGECGSMYPLKREQAIGVKRNSELWDYNPLQTIMEIGRKSRSWIKYVIKDRKKTSDVCERANFLTNIIKVDKTLPFKTRKLSVEFRRRRSTVYSGAR